MRSPVNEKFSMLNLQFSIAVSLQIKNLALVIANLESNPWPAARQPLLVGRATPCAPFPVQRYGAHGVTRPTVIRSADRP